MRVVFMGTPAFAVPTLRALVEAGHEVVSVLSQPDRPVGRGRHLTAPPVKVAALELGLDVFQPHRVKDPQAFGHLEAARADVFVVVGYGQIVPRAVIDLPLLGCVNVHASLLPKYRGAAPIHWAIVRGETTTGVTTMLIEERLDAGDMLLERETPIGPDETAVDLAARLAPMGADLAIETLAGLQDGLITPRKQNDAEATLAPILKREDGKIDWGLPAGQIFNRVRGFVPWPGSYTSFRGKRLHIHRARPHASPRAGDSPGPGLISASGDEVRVCCGEGTILQIEEVQMEGKKRMAAADFLHGRQPRENERLGDETLGKETP